MKRFIAGTALSVHALLGVPAAHASEINADQCAAVYDESLSADGIDPELQRQIGLFDDEGTDVHVQIHEDMHDDGIVTGDDLEQYGATTAQDCGWNTNSNINILISRQPAANVLQLEGIIGVQIDGKEYDALTAATEKHIQDGLTSHQQDAAAVLAQLYAFSRDTPGPESAEKPVPQPTQVPRLGIPGSADPAPSEPTTTAPPAPETPETGGTATPTGETPSDGLPLTPLLGGLALMGGSAVRLRRGYQIRQRKDAVPGPGLDTTLKDVLEQAETITQDLAPADAENIKQQTTDAAHHLIALSASRNELLQKYEQERRRIWPSLGRMQQLAADASSHAATADHDLRQLQASVAEIQDCLAHMTERETAFHASLDAVQETADALQADGWNLDTVPVAIRTIRKTQDQIRELRGDDQIIAPSRLIIGTLPQIAQLQDTLVALPAVREQAAQTAAEDSRLLSDVIQTVRGSRTVLDSLRVEYHASCTAGIDGHGESLAVQLTQLSDMHTEAQELAGSKDISALSESAALHERFVHIAGAIKAGAAEIVQQQRVLENLKATLPAELAAIGGHIRQAADFAREAGATDIEETTRSSIATLQQEYQLEADTLAGPLPPYLQLNERMSLLKNDIMAVASQAVAEKREMDSLRETNQQLHIQASQNIASLQAFLAQHTDDIDPVRRQAVEALRVSDPDASMTRSQLRQQVDVFAQGISLVQQVRAQVEADVALAVQQREIAEAAIAAAQAEAARQAEFARHVEATRQAEAAAYAEHQAYPQQPHPDPR